MRVYSFFLVGISSMSLLSCSTMSGQHRHERGSVVALDSATEAHICIGGVGLSPGKKVKVFDSVCRQATIDDVNRLRSRLICEKVYAGDAEIIEVSSEHFSKVRSLGNLSLKVGQVVE